MVVLAERAGAAADGSVAGHVQAGVLLNRNLAFIDHINEIVYPGRLAALRQPGTATLFLDDVRISTNVRLFGPTRHAARSARASSQTMCATVRARWTRAHLADRAFVVSDWYVSAYEPLTDGAGRRVGMLYVGFLEQRRSPGLKYGALAASARCFFAVMIGAALYRCAARGHLPPIWQMARPCSASRGRDGRARRRSGQPTRSASSPAPPDHLLDVIAEKTRALQRWNAELDAKVAERTQALRPRSSSWYAARSWPRWASSPPASRTR